MRWRSRVVEMAVLFLALGCGDTKSGPNRQPQAPATLFEDVLPGVVYTRGPGGAVVPGAGYERPQDVLLFGIGLRDGEYRFVVVDDDCEQNLMPGQAARIVHAAGGKFGPEPLVPFIALSPTSPATEPGELYRVYAAPVSLVTNATANCFGFPPLASLTTVFSLRTTESVLRR